MIELIQSLTWIDIGILMVLAGILFFLHIDKDDCCPKCQAPDSGVGKCESCGHRYVR